MQIVKNTNTKYCFFDEINPLFSSSQKLQSPEVF